MQLVAGSLRRGPGFRSPREAEPSVIYRVAAVHIKGRVNDLALPRATTLWHAQQSRVHGYAGEMLWLSRNMFCGS
jgi:hypothetical protein